MTSHQRGWHIITSLLTGLVFLLMFWVSLLELFLSLIDPSFASISFHIRVSFMELQTYNLPSSHCTPQLANHAAFVISTIWTDKALSHSPFLSHLDREIALEGWGETAICQGHRLHCAICHGVRLREFGRLALFWLSQLNPRFSTMLLTLCTRWRWC